MKILILHASAGAGHRRAAEALAAACLQEGIQPIVHDILEFTPPLFRTTYAAGYLNMVRSAPELWGYLYSLTDRKSQTPWHRRIRTTFNKLNTKSFERFRRELQADAVICTHFLPLEILGRRRPKDAGKVPLFGVVTDFAAHSLWSCPNVDGYFTGCEEARRQLIRMGQPPGRAWVTGIPISPEFVPPADVVNLRIRMGLAPDLPVILILCGGFGVGAIVDVLGAFAKEPLQAQLVVVTGNNEALRDRAARKARELTMPVMLHGFVSNIHELIGVADVVISKPGGLTSAEVLVMGCPLVIMDPIPGQEQRNGEYLLENGAAVRLVDPWDAPFKVWPILENHERRRSISAAALRLAKPDAARVIVREVARQVGRV
ncbi:MAG: glycosyltransferase [bacterium]